MKLLALSTFFVLLLSSASRAQQGLQPGFLVQEYLDLLGVAAQQYDSLAPKDKVPLSPRYKFLYRSPEVGLMNRWALWLRDDQVAVIDIRGTTKDTPSWLENFYAAMVPATGSLTLNDSTTFTYQLAADPKAMVHIGWLLGLGHLSPTILTQIRAQHAKGIRNFILMGHSQGAALTLLLRSYLHYLVQKGDLPKDLNFKTYCSACPKPGNLFFAYDYEYITRNGTAFTILNAADWVPETPFSLQTLKDFNAVNPFQDIKPKLRKQSFLVRVYAGTIFRKLDGRTRRSQRTFEKYLGRQVSKLVKKSLPQFQTPDYAPSNNYMRAGVPIVLQPDEAYRREFPDNPEKVFMHHGFVQYASLAKRIYQSN
ncbi:lipase family protein [Tellurirhabdus bombi]|uniref:lipase family protein n=1 Tax=Tellurirhabdus bombi TaxID=2907205 RepID=UPI001F3E4E02|nr:lipase family protein [Tellurirhabdus bombi]